MASPREIASAFVRLFVRRDELRADLEASKQEVRQASESMQADAKKAGSVATEAGKGIRRAFSTELIGAITGTAAAFGAVVLAARRLISAWGDAQKISDDLRASIDGITKASNAYLDSLNGINQTQGQKVAQSIRQQIVGIQEEIDRLTNASGPSIDGFAEAVFGVRVPQLREEMQRLEKILSDVTAAESRKRAQERSKERRETAEAGLDALEAAMEAEAKAGSERKKRLDKEREEIAETERIRREEFAKSAQFFEQSFIDAGNSIRQSFSGGFSADQRVLVDAINELRDVLRGRL